MKKKKKQLPYFKFDTINYVTGKKEPFSGTFFTEKEADYWYNKYYEFFKKRGIPLYKKTYRGRKAKIVV